jgi:hypothetical protein
VIVSRSPLATLFPDSPEQDSPLAGLCHLLRVSPFTLVTSQRFILYRLKDTGVTFTDDQISALILESRGYPGQLQEAASYLFRQITEKE